MTAAFFIILLVVWMLFSGWRFYKEVNWDEAPGVTPDLGELRKKEAALGLTQDVLHQAQDEGRISAACVNEFDRYCDEEIQAIRSATQPRKKVIQ